MGPIAVAGNISQFYPSGNLHKDHWAYQLIIGNNGKIPDRELLVGVVTKLIFSLRCVSTQCEEVVRRLAEEQREPFNKKTPGISDLVRNSKTPPPL